MRKATPMRELLRSFSAWRHRANLDRAADATDRVERGYRLYRADLWCARERFLAGLSLWGEYRAAVTAAQTSFQTRLLGSASSPDDASRQVFGPLHLPAPLHADGPLIVRAMPAADVSSLGHRQSPSGEPDDADASSCPCVVRHPVGLAGFLSRISSLPSIERDPCFIALFFAGLVCLTVILGVKPS